jgi:hypothetical protein
MPALIATKKRQGVNRQHVDQPAELTDANGVENEAQGEHGGGYMRKSDTVAPFTKAATRI